MLRRRFSTLIAFAFVVISALGSIPSRAATDQEVRPAEIESLTRAWLDALWTHYATGESAIADLSTPAGLEALRAFDWRYEAVEAGDRRFVEDHRLVDASGREPWEYSGDEQISFGVDVTVDVAPYAETRSADARVLEIATGSQRRLLNLRFVREPGTNTWLMDDIGAPADDDYEVGLAEPARSRPCPGLRRGRSGADPFLARTWCTANGRGRSLVYGRRFQAERPPEIFVDREPCGPESSDAYLMYLGTPPGAPIAPYASGDYVRDPDGVMPGAAAYRRDIRRPRDAISTGITNGSATIWTSESLGQDAIIIQVGGRFELWPASSAGCGGPT